MRMSNSSGENYQGTRKTARLVTCLFSVPGGRFCLGSNWVSAKTEPSSSQMWLAGADKWRFEWEHDVNEVIVRPCLTTRR